ncbi:unnamed protein product [Arabis nemorensis]|uniref:Uncharacterized protein n=1 Tax=Arabis nemorensis TaxID=586526 RepID=A0A565C5Q7_9BRAS|nr:unnamed protein product [Arabis nemorensis]
MATSSSGPKWAQKIITLPPLKRGCHLITPKIMKEIGKDLSDFNCGLAHVFASLTINENYDPDVQADTETFLNRIVPELLGGIQWKVQMTCHLISNHQCLDANSREGHNLVLKT